MEKKYELITSQKKHQNDKHEVKQLFSMDALKKMQIEECKSAKVKTYDYEFKIFAGNMLVFNALITQDTSNFLIAPLPEIGIDESFKDIFTRVIKGEFRLNYIEKSDFEAFELKARELVINEGSAYENLKKFESICEQYLYVRAEVLPTTFKEILKFRFDGPHYHLGYGLPYKEAGILEELSNELVDAVTANRTDFSVVLQTQKEAASTAIPYMSQTYDASALDVVKQCIRDINDHRIDTDFIAENTKNSKIYKNFIERLAGVAKLKDLEAFEVFVLGEKCKIHDISFLKKIKDNLYRTDEQIGTGEVRYFHPHKYGGKGSLCLSVDGVDTHFHVYTNDDLYEKIRDIGYMKQGKNASYRAIQISDFTYQLRSIYLTGE